MRGVSCDASTLAMTSGMGHRRRAQDPQHRRRRGLPWADRHGALLARRPGKTGADNAPLTAPLGRCCTPA